MVVVLLVSLLRAQYYTLLLFLYFEILYVILLSLFGILGVFYQVPSSYAVFIYLIAISSIKSIVGLGLLINYTRNSNSLLLF